MKGFKEFLIENTEEPDNSELIAGVESSFKKHFPNSRITSVSSKRVTGNFEVTFEIFLISEQSEQSSNIWRNDPMHALFNIKGDSENYIAERVMGEGIYLKPPVGVNLVMQRGKVPFRKARGNSKKMISTFDTHFKRLKDFVKSNEDNIYRRDQIKDKYFQ